MKKLTLAALSLATALAFTTPALLVTPATAAATTAATKAPVKTTKAATKTATNKATKSARNKKVCKDTRTQKCPVTKNKKKK